MTNEERASLNSKALKKIADDIEEIRMELYSYSLLEDDKVEVDDKLFSIQSQLRDVANIVECYT